VKNRRLLSTGDVATYCSVAPMTVIRWIKLGKLRAYPTPGGHRRIRKEDFLDFLRAHQMFIDREFFGEAHRTAESMDRNRP